MIVVMEHQASQGAVDALIARLREMGFDTHLSVGVERTIIGAIGPKRPEYIQQLGAMAGVDRIVPILQPFKLAGREFHAEGTAVQVGAVTIGAEPLVVMAGPCAVEGEEQLLKIAREIKSAGAHMLRGGAFKPRTSPYSFQGLEEEGLRILALAREQTGLPVVTEVVNPRDVELVAQYADMLQIGARNMQNFTLLKEVGKTQKPVLLKRGLSATVEEWLMAAEYIISGGNEDVVLCERGIRTYETETRNTLDLSAVPAIKHYSHLPVIVDPSHGTGRWRYVTPMARAAVAAGADGLMVEVHSEPEKALSDGAQSLTPKNFQQLIEEVEKIAEAIGRDARQNVIGVQVNETQ
ncbi:MAG: 3-deoxy-7-phosphoheptulonate synthase [Firmicutes bacterium]|nr:3-deoxy-7-phosphoheptulonate synthase [Bacillota bacterium]